MTPNATGEIRAFTAGEKAVGLSFNPSNDEKVQKLKELFAQAFDIVEQSIDLDRLENELFTFQSEFVKALSVNRVLHR